MNLKHIKTDFFGGLTAAIVALPLALAFGVQSGMGAVAGMYGAIILGFFASLLGGTPCQVSGPTGPMTVISSLAIATMVAKYGSLEAALPSILIIFMLTGVVQVILGFMKIGQIVRYIPYPVISGFMTGIGIIIIMLQIFPGVGLDSPKAVLDVLIKLPHAIQHINWAAFSLTLATIVTIYLLPLISRTLPSPIVAIVGLSGMSYYFGLSVPTIGEIPAGLPQLELSKMFQYDFSQNPLVIEFALTLAALGAIDSLLTSVVADNMTQTKHNSNRELVGQGIGNFISAFFAGLPGAGATMRTVININAGGRTKISGMLHSIFLFVVVLGAGPLAAKIPLAVLSGILITVGISIVDYRGLMHTIHVPRSDAFIMVAVICLTVFVDLLQAVAAGMILAAFFFMKKSSDLAEEKTKVAPLVDYQDELPWTDDNLLPEYLSSQVYIKHIEGPLFFGFVSQFKNLVKAIPNVRYVIIRMNNVPYVDQSGLYALEDSILYLESIGIDVLFTGMHEQPIDMLKGIRLIPELVKEDNIFESFAECVKWLDDQLNHTS